MFFLPNYAKNKYDLGNQTFFISMVQLISKSDLLWGLPININLFKTTKYLVSCSALNQVLAILKASLHSIKNRNESKQSICSDLNPEIII